jgi:hypothetical protein
VGDIVAILNDSGEQIMPRDECYIVHGHAPRVVQLNGSRPSCAGPIIAGSRSRAATRAVRGICTTPAPGELVTMLDPRSSAASLANGAERWTLDVDRPALLNVIFGLKPVGCLQRRRPSHGSTPLMKQSQLKVDNDVIVGSRSDCRFQS